MSIHDANLNSMVWPWWLGIGTPVKFSLWLSNRLATWAGLLFVWKRFRARRLIWLWIALINAVSLALLGALFFWMRHRVS